MCCKGQQGFKTFDEEPPVWIYKRLRALPIKFNMERKSKLDIKDVPGGIAWLTCFFVDAC